MKKTKAIEKIEEKGSALEIYAKKLIVTKDNIQEVNEKLAYCKEATKKINKFMFKHVDKPFAIYKAGFDIRKDMLSSFVNCKKIAGAKSAEYETIEAARLEKIRTDAEAKRLKDEADLKQKILDDAKVIEDAKQKILDDAKALEDAGKKKQAEKLKSNAEVLGERVEDLKLQSSMTFIPSETIAPTSAKVKGISYSDWTEILITDQKAFLKSALVNNYDLFESCIEINISKLRKIAVDNKFTKFAGLSIEKKKKQRG